MGFIGIAICTACYIATAIDFYIKGNSPMAIAFGGYSVANIGFLIIAYKQ
jgi:hypothetical protein